MSVLFLGCYLRHGTLVSKPVEWSRLGDNVPLKSPAISNLPGKEDNGEIIFQKHLDNLYWVHKHLPK